MFYTPLFVVLVLIVALFRHFDYHRMIEPGTLMLLFGVVWLVTGLVCVAHYDAVSNVNGRDAVGVLGCACFWPLFPIYDFYLSVRGLFVSVKAEKGVG